MAAINCLFGTRIPKVKNLNTTFIDSYNGPNDSYKPKHMFLKLLSKNKTECVFLCLVFE